MPNAHLKDIKAETCRIGATFSSKVKLAVKLAAVVTITSLVAMSDLIYSRAFVAVQPQPKRSMIQRREEVAKFSIGQHQKERKCHSPI